MYHAIRAVLADIRKGRLTDAPLPPRTFSTLALAFLKAQRIVPDRSQVKAPADNQMEPRLLDPNLASDWRDFHREMAVVRIVTRRANMERNAEAKVRKKDRQLILG